MKNVMNFAMENAIKAIEQSMKPSKPDPINDPRLVSLRQLHELNNTMLKRCETAEFHAKQATSAARSAFAETKVRLEILMEELGLLVEEEECEHGDTDEGECLDCGADLRESMMADAYDREKDARKYGGT